MKLLLLVRDLSAKRPAPKVLARRLRQVGFWLLIAGGLLVALFCILSWREEQDMIADGYGYEYESIASSYIWMLSGGVLLLLLGTFVRVAAAVCQCNSRNA